MINKKSQKTSRKAEFLNIISFLSKYNSTFTRGNSNPLKISMNSLNDNHRNK